MCGGRRRPRVEHMSYSSLLEDEPRTPTRVQRLPRVLGAVAAAVAVTGLVQWFALSNASLTVRGQGEEVGNTILMLVGFVGHVLLIPLLFGVFARWLGAGPALSSTLLGFPVFLLTLWLISGLAFTARNSWGADLLLLEVVGFCGIHLVAALLSFGVLALVLREERKNTGPC